MLGCVEFCVSPTLSFVERNQKQQSQIFQDFCLICIDLPVSFAGKSSKRDELPQATWNDERQR